MSIKLVEKEIQKLDNAHHGKKEYCEFEFNNYCESLACYSNKNCSAKDIKGNINYKE